MWGDKYWEDWRGGVSGGAVLSPVEGLGAAPRKKNQFCAKNYAILSKFWHFFPILQHKNFQHAKIVTSTSEKVGGGIIPPVLKVGDISPFPPCSDAYDWYAENKDAFNKRRLSKIWTREGRANLQSDQQLQHINTQL